MDGYRLTTKRITHALCMLAAGTVLALALSPTPAFADSNDVDAPIASGECGTCVWTIDPQGALVIAPKEGNVGTLADWGHTPPWSNYRSQITSAQLEGTVHAQTCSEMFHGCENLADIDLTGLETSKAKSMSNMFSICTSLKSLDVSSLNTSSARGMNSMFQFCSQVETIDVSHFDTSQVKYMGNMFSSCTNLKSIGACALDMTAVENASLMFYDCTSLTSAKFASNGPSALTTTSGMFVRCSSLSEVDFTGLEAPHVDNASSMFDWCTSLKEVDLGFLDEAPLSNASSMFCGCSSLEKITVGPAWSIGESASSARMFDNCTSLVGANGTAFDPEHIDGEYARIDTAETPGYFWSAKSDDSEGGNSDPATDYPTDKEKDGESSPTDDSGNGPSGDKPATPGTLVIAKPISLSKATVSLSATSYTYNGKARTPKVTVRLGSKTLRDGTDYSVSYPKGRANAGTYKVVVRGKGAYTASASANFKITRASLAKARVALSKASYACTGKACKPSATVKLGGKTLKTGRDFTLSYPKGCKDVGTYKVTVKGKGNYKSKVTAKFTIVPKTPSIASLKAHKNSNGTSGFIASWRKSGNGCGYQLRWSSTKALKKTESAEFDKSTSYAKSCSAALRIRTASWLGKNAYVQVRAFQKAGSKTYYSAWSAIKSVKSKK